MYSCSSQYAGLAAGMSVLPRPCIETSSQNVQRGDAGYCATAMAGQSMYGQMSNAFSASRNGRGNEPFIIGEDTNPLQSTEIIKGRMSAAGASPQQLF